MLFEPACPSYLKKIYDFRVRIKDVKENYYSLREYKTFARSCGFKIYCYHYKNYKYRWSNKSIVYYLFLNIIPNFLTFLFPCTQIIIGEKEI
ncbi:MAG TPA: hypothetical protein PK130_00880 [Candidatus Pacearchaeota archaeon]|nr:hypothetical protein [Candidatus Pacearchaeota archaeon]